MKPKGSTLSIVIYYVLIVLLAYGCGRQEGLSDARYIEIAKSTPEAKKYLEIYPEAIVQVDHSGRLAVDFRFDPDNSLAQNSRLRIFIDRFTLKPNDIFLECRNKGKAILIKEPDIIKHLTESTCVRRSH